MSKKLIKDVCKENTSKNDSETFGKSQIMQVGANIGSKLPLRVE